MPKLFREGIWLHLSDSNWGFKAGIQNWYSHGWRREQFDYAHRTAPSNGGADLLRFLNEDSLRQLSDSWSEFLLDSLWGFIGLKLA